MDSDASTAWGYSVAWIQHLTPLFTSCASLSQLLSISESLSVKARFLLTEMLSGLRKSLYHWPGHLYWVCLIAKPRTWSTLRVWGRPTKTTNTHTEGGEALKYHGMGSVQGAQNHALSWRGEERGMGIWTRVEWIWFHQNAFPHGTHQNYATYAERCTFPLGHNLCEPQFLQFRIMIVPISGSGCENWVK